MTDRGKGELLNLIIGVFLGVAISSMVYMVSTLDDLEDDVDFSLEYDSEILTQLNQLGDLELFVKRRRFVSKYDDDKTIYDYERCDRASLSTYCESKFRYVFQAQDGSIVLSRIDTARVIPKGFQRFEFDR